jgi:hypothetical protein
LLAYQNVLEKGDATLFLDADGTTERKRVASPLFKTKSVFKYDRKLNTILFRAAWGGALSQVLGVDDRELAAIFTVQTAG